MITTNDLFAQFGAGRESSWEEPAWRAVLKVLADHQGESYNQSDNKGLFDDLEEALQGVQASFSARGQDPDRSLFRAAKIAWTGTGVARLDASGIEVTAEGHAVLTGTRTYEACLKHLFIHYSERNGKNPFIPILQYLNAHQYATLDELFDAVQREIGPQMDDWLRSANLRGFPYKYSRSTRAVRLQLTVLQRAGLIQELAPDSWALDNAQEAQSVLARHTAAQPSAPGAGSIPLDEIVHAIESAGWQFEPWQIATYCLSVQTKPLVILAGISGTGKSKLPALVAQATGARFTEVPVRPDWRDSSDLLGYVDLGGGFRPGPLLAAARTAIENPHEQHFVLLDEMNLARVEYYLAEVLSRIEGRVPDGHGGYRTRPLLTEGLAIRDADQLPGMPWQEVYLPGNLALIGSVNMDETTHGFSRKVLDRAFVLEFSTVDLGRYDDPVVGLTTVQTVGAAAWASAAARLADHPDKTDDVVRQVVRELEQLNEALAPAQLQVGYRLRDEASLFALQARGCAQLVDRSGEDVDAVDLVLAMKVLPRVQGGGPRMKALLDALETWAGPEDRPRLPQSHARIQILRSRWKDDGYANYWL